jgi:glycine hydroxymethyltransferase
MVFPGMQGGPLMHVIAAKAVAMKEALTEDFRKYQQAIVENARTLADELKKRGFELVSGGTDNHLVLINLTNRGITGKEAEDALDRAGISVNKNTIPFDPLPPATTSGIRVGTPCVTTRGMGPEEMLMIAGFMDEALRNTNNPSKLEEIRKKAGDLTLRFPIYP